MIATVTFNPCLDKHITVNGFKLNETNRWTSLPFDMTAVTFSSLKNLSPVC